MSHIEIPIWNKCNNRCLMCTNTTSMMEESCFTFTAVINFFKEELKKSNCAIPESVGLTGGETTICPYFFRILKYIRKKFPKTIMRLLTNGRMLAYDNFRDKCLTFKNIDFMIPLHAHSAEIHDQITQTSGSFHQTVGGLKKLFIERKDNQKIEIRVIVNRYNLAIIPKIFELIKNNFIDADRVVLIFPEFEGKAEENKNAIGITYAQIQPALERIKKYSKIFKDFRLYHFPLCVLDSSLWPYAWRTLPSNEVTYLPECQKCLLKEYCLGVHKSYFSYVKNPEIKSRTSLKGIEIKKTGSFYKPIEFVQ